MLFQTRKMLKKIFLMELSYFSSSIESQFTLSFDHLKNAQQKLNHTCWTPENSPHWFL